MLIAADSGGSNGSRVRLWKRELQKLANELGLDIVVTHLPPGTSKWNKIEHRLFSFISQNWRAQPLVSYRVIVELISATTCPAASAGSDPEISGLRIKASTRSNRVERPAPATGRNLGLGRPGRCQRPLRRQRDEGVVLSVVALDPRQQRRDILDRRQLLSTDELGRLGEAKEGEIVGVSLISLGCIWTGRLKPESARCPFSRWSAATRALRSPRRQYGDRLDLEQETLARELSHLHRG